MAGLRRCPRQFARLRTAIERGRTRPRPAKLDDDLDRRLLAQTVSKRVAAGNLTTGCRNDRSRLVDCGTTNVSQRRTYSRANGTYLSPWRVPIFSDALACDVTRLFEPWVRLRSSFPHSWFDAPGAVPNTRLRDQVEQETLVVGCCQTSGQPFSP
jgi:hypothetical protein